jgi:hypothetical protein
MKKTSKFNLRCLFVFVFFFVSGCGHVSTGTWNQPFPAGDILFQARMQDPYELNLVQADGTNHQIVNLPHNFVRPVWSANGEIMYALSNLRGTFPYKDIGLPAYWNLKSGYYKDCVEDLPYYWQIEPSPTLESPNAVLLHGAFEIILFDMDTCKQIKTIFDLYDQEGHAHLQGFSYNQDTQELVFGEIVNPPYPPSYHIKLLNLNTGEQSELGNGFYPIWSPDGTRIAFFGMDGLYVIKADENKARRLIPIQFSYPKRTLKPEYLVSPPRWSPDGEWLVYHLCVTKLCWVDEIPIYKIRVSDGFQVQLYTGGQFPGWRP